MTTAPKIIALQSAGPGVLTAVLETINQEPKGSQPDVLDLDPAHWTVNGAHPVAIHRYSLPWYEQPKAADGTYEITVRHSVFLTLGQPFVDATSYAVACPYGNAGLVFGNRTTFASCIKTNQSAYAKASTARFANLGVWLGDGGPMALSPLPAYEVIRESDGAVIYKGTAAAGIDDTGLAGPKSGEIVHRLDLSAVPEGGAYFVSVPGIGRSRSFWVGGDVERRTAIVALHSLTIARCGQELKEPWSPWARPACHPRVTDARSPYPGSGFIQVPSGAQTFEMRGMRHDAGDFDRNPNHAIIPILLLTYFEAWPSHFTDRQYDIPESGNGTPDLLDEALWDVLGLEHLQITDANDPLNGGVRSGTEQARHPDYGIDNAVLDKGVYSTWGVDGQADSPGEGFTAFAAGIFAQASRLVRPYDAAHADDLLGRARLAWGYHASHNTATAIKAYNLYASLQLYLTTGESPFHDLFKAQANAILVKDGSWPVQYRGGNLAAKVQTVHFASYTLPTSRAVDATLVDAIKARVIREADQGGYHGIHPLTDPYPVGATKFLGYGALTAPGRNDADAFASLYETDPAKKQQRINKMSLLADGILGLNAMGMSYVVGIGTDQPNCPGHLDSFFAEKDTLHPIPGVMVYGPSEGRSGYDYQMTITNKLVPSYEQLPIGRRFVHAWASILNAEDTIWEVRVWFAVLMAFLHDASKDPAPTLPPPPQPSTGVTLTADQCDRFTRAVSDLNAIRDELGLKAS